MRLTMIQFWQAVRASYWFVPSIMTALAIALGALMVWLDSGPLANLFDGVAWYQQSKPAGAREVLSAIASSAITVAGVAFSITIVAISFAANQYGPRILTNFMSDRGNQVTLGTFISTFVYCIVVLRTIYSGDTDFVPQLAIVVALLLAFASTAMLIFFIHHVPHSIHVNTVLAGVGRQLVHSIEKRFPACIGDPPEQSDKDRSHFAQIAESHFASAGDWKEIDCLSNGYLQAVDKERILSIATDHDLVVRMERSPGEFLYRGQVLFRVSPADRVSDEVRDELRGSWSVGNSRTPSQDQMFLIDELVEIAARALSTGVNDPYTAITCVDWLTAGAAEIARRREPSPYRLDDDGNLRVVAPSSSFALHIARGFGRLRPYAAKDVNAAAHVLSQCAILAYDCESQEQVEVLATEAEQLIGLATEANRGASLERINLEAASARAAFSHKISSIKGNAFDVVEVDTSSKTFVHRPTREANRRAATAEDLTR